MLINVFYLLLPSWQLPLLLPTRPILPKFLLPPFEGPPPVTKHPPAHHLQVVGLPLESLELAVHPQARWQAAKEAFQLMYR